MFADILKSFLDDSQNGRLLSWIQAFARSRQFRLDRRTRPDGHALDSVHDGAIQAQLVKERRPELADERAHLPQFAAQGDLAGAAGALGLHDRMLPTTGDAAVAIVMAAANYPETPRKGDKITGLEDAARDGANIFHAGTVLGPDGAYCTNGGRVLAVVALGAGIPAARAAAEEAAEHISWDGMQRRHDIAAKLPNAATTPPASPDPVSEKAWTEGVATGQTAPQAPDG